MLPHSYVVQEGIILCQVLFVFHRRSLAAWGRGNFQERFQKCSNIYMKTLAECPQCYCGEIRQMLTFLMNLYCPKAYHKPDHSIRIVEYRRKNIPKTNIFTETRTRDRFRVFDFSSCNLVERNKQFCSLHRSKIVLSFRAT
jgi:hypothetical protein